MSDEKDCEIMLLDEHFYRKQLPPIEDMNHHVHVDVSCRILNMGNFNDLAMSYVVKFILILKWHDHRLTYTNLKQDYHENLVNDEKKHAIWIPPLTLNNTDGNVMVSIDDPHSNVYVERSGQPTIGPPSIMDETLFYSGHDSKVVFISEYELNFHCSFDLVCYPFDTQICGMEVRDCFSNLSQYKLQNNAHLCIFVLLLFQKYML